MNDFSHNRIEAVSLLTWIAKQLLPLIRRGQFEGLGWHHNRAEIIANSDQAVQQALEQLLILSRDPEEWLEDPMARRSAAITYEEFGLLLSLLEEYRRAKMKRLHEQGEPV